MHYVIFSSIPGLYLLDVGSPPLDVTNRTVSRYYQYPLFTWVENYSVFPFTAVTNYHSLPGLKQHELTLL